VAQKGSEAAKSNMLSRRAVLLFAAACGLLPAQTVTTTFTVSMPQPANHLMHVTMRCDGLRGEFHDFYMPAWAPGYYRLLDFQKNVQNFRAEDDAGHPLGFEKNTKNSWRVASSGASAVRLSYDVLATVSFPVQNFLSDARALLSPPGLFVYELGQLSRPVTVELQPPAGWKSIATGLDRVAGKPATFTAADFDTLYDSPILMGNQELLQFSVRGVRHDVSLENVAASVDRPKMLADLTRMVDAASRLIGDLPYTHYAFLMVGMGNGGVEHLNSASILFNGNSLGTPEGYLRWLSYVCHEYFHNFNVKRIRPIALGPFDYEAENQTNMLWVSEGLSVYYEDLVLVRAGLMTREQYLDKMAASIGRFENTSGHRYQSATESSWTTWGTSGVGGDRNTGISYYDNGAMIGAMLDLAIRNASHNRKSLDDAMRGIYGTFYKSKKRGFTDAEFRQECEKAAGAPLEEVFSYASTSVEPDYAKYFALAGLEARAAAEEAPGAYLGANVQAHDNKLVVTSVDADSPAAAAGMRVGDEIAQVEGAKVTPKVLNDALLARKPGEALHLTGSRDVTVTLGKNSKKTWTIHPAASPNELQSQILKDWMRSQQ
jgi:predicted metalloprotease with PDZ domain